MTITVTAPNGATVQFPDGTDHATINNVMSQNFRQDAPAAPFAALVSRSSIPLPSLKPDTAPMPPASTAEAAARFIRPASGASARAAVMPPLAKPPPATTPPPISTASPINPVFSRALSMRRSSRALA